MSFQKALAVRFSQNARDRLDAVARKSRLKVSDLVREAVDRYLREVDSTGEVSFELNEDSPKKPGKR